MKAHINGGLAVGAPLLAVLIGVASGCSEDRPPGPPEMDMCEPWRQMSLPTNGGRVWYCDATAVKVLYPDGGDTAELRERYVAAVETGGWTRRDLPDEDMAGFDKDGRTLSVVVRPSDFSGTVPNGVEVSISTDRAASP